MIAHPRDLAAENGQASIVTLWMGMGAIALGFILLAVGSWYIAQAELQQAADVAAASMSRPVGDDPVSRARALARANGADDFTITTNVQGQTEIRVTAAGPHVAGIHIAGHVVATAIVRAPQPDDTPTMIGNGGSAGIASGGLYSGPLMGVDAATICPAVGAEYLDMQRAAAVSGVRLYAVSGFRTFAEQAVLYAQLGSGIAAPPGTSLHHAATEFDLAVGSSGSPTHRWLSMNAGRYHFIQRYSWEPWHWGNTVGC
ncbi:MAG: D-alanyl-D-alanine carboxypeptidase family protein [Thermoleophilia bacterium]|nr:D-alanyl-D-alanine carboxypeptidase family protein [Thermoleophilia bacterium]